MPLFESDDISLMMVDEELPTVQCGICGTEHAAPECKWNDAEEDEDIAF